MNSGNLIFNICMSKVHCALPRDFKLKVNTGPAPVSGRPLGLRPPRASAVSPTCGWGAQVTPTGTRAQEVTGPGPGPGTRLLQDHVARGWAWASGKVGGAPDPRTQHLCCPRVPQGPQMGRKCQSMGPQTLSWWRPRAPPAPAFTEEMKPPRRMGCSGSICSSPGRMAWHPVSPRCPLPVAPIPHQQPIEGHHVPSLLVPSPGQGHCASRPHLPQAGLDLSLGTLGQWRGPEWAFLREGVTMGNMEAVGFSNRQDHRQRAE